MQLFQPREQIPNERTINQPALRADKYSQPCPTTLKHKEVS